MAGLRRAAAANWVIASGLAAEGGTGRARRFPVAEGHRRQAFSPDAPAGRPRRGDLDASQATRTTRDLHREDLGCFKTVCIVIVSLTDIDHPCSLRAHNDHRTLHQTDIKAARRNDHTFSSLVNTGILHVRR